MSVCVGWWTRRLIWRTLLGVVNNWYLCGTANSPGTISWLPDAMAGGCFQTLTFCACRFLPTPGPSSSIMECIMAERRFGRKRRQPSINQSITHWLGFAGAIHCAQAKRPQAFSSCIELSHQPPSHLFIRQMCEHYFDKKINWFVKVTKIHRWHKP